MTVSGMTMRKGTLETWGNPDAPPDYGRGRWCSMDTECQTYKQLVAKHDTPEPGRINRYAEDHGKDAQGEPILLCSACNSYRIREGLTARQLTRRPKPPRAKSYELPRLRLHRERAGLTRYELAERAGCGTEHIRNIENPNLKPPKLAGCQLATRIAEVLGVDVRTLRGTQVKS